MHVYETHGYCFSCAKLADIFSIVCKHRKCKLEQAVEWLLQQHNIPVEQVIRDKPKDYQGPVPRLWIEYWANQLTEEKAQYLYDRLLSPETIRKNRIGYRPDKDAYVFPFWCGVPGESDIDIIQYRAAPTNSSELKYWGEKGYNRPSIINRHVFNSEMVIFCLGTIDSYLGIQDGLPMPSPNGATQFTNPNRAETLWLQHEMEKVKQKYVLVDSTLVEFEAAHKLASLIEAEVIYFPRSCGAKDYNQYRMQGNTIQNFYEEILEMSMKTIWNGRLFAVADIHLGITEQCLRDMAQGNAALSFRKVLEIAGETGYSAGCFSHALSMMADSLGPTGCNAPFTSEEWREFMDELDEAGTSYTDLRNCIAKWNNLASSRLGGF